MNEVQEHIVLACDELLSRSEPTDEFAKLANAMLRAYRDWIAAYASGGDASDEIVPVVFRHQNADWSTWGKAAALFCHRLGEALEPLPRNIERQGHTFANVFCVRLGQLGPAA